MPKFVVLANFTEKGVGNFKDVPDRLSDWKKQAAARGAEVKEVLGVMGPFDTLSIVSAPSDEVMARLVLDVEALGNVRTQTLRAFTEEELRKIVK